jgi:hypothetical protein
LESSTFSHFLDNLPIDVGDIVSLKRLQPFHPQKDFWYSLLLDRLCGLGAEFLAAERRCIVLPVRYELNYICYVEESRPPLLYNG